MGDPVRLAQSMGNLLHNAAKFTPKGGQIRRRGARCDGEHGAHRGAATTASASPRTTCRASSACSPRRAVPPDRAPEGLGIGLSLVSRLLEMHGGRLAATSPGIGLGSTFTVELPVLRTLGRARQPAPAAARRRPRRPGRAAACCWSTTTSTRWR